MNKILNNVASAVVSTVIITIGVKVIVNEIPNGTKKKIGNKVNKTYKAIKESLRNEPV